jgi:hypothetical protein
LIGTFVINPNPQGKIVEKHKRKPKTLERKTMAKRSSSKKSMDSKTYI